MKTLLARLKGQRPAPAAALPAVSLGVCGKHPCEEDHFSLYGDGAVRLPDVMRRIYTEGIKQNIESGAWEQLEPAKRLSGFDHLFLCIGPGELIVGRIWPSRDRVGRDIYPIIYAAECRGCSVKSAVEQIVPELERLAERCREARSRQSMQSELSGTQDKLVAAGLAPSSGGADADASAALVHCDDLGPDRQGLHRVLYRLLNEAAGYLHGAAPTRNATEHPACHLRVPVCAPTSARAVQRWAGFLAGVLGPSAPVLLFTPESQSWLDIVIGPPAAEHTFFLCSSAETLSSEIPYPIDESFTRKVDLLIDQTDGNQVRGAGVH